MLLECMSPLWTYHYLYEYHHHYYVAPIRHQVPVEVGPEMRTSAGCSAAFRPSASAPDSVIAGRVNRPCIILIYSVYHQLSLQGKGSTSNNGTVSLKSLIANYFVDEELTDFSCDKCHCKSTKATKSTKVIHNIIREQDNRAIVTSIITLQVTASPDILVIHLRRFTAQGRKINTAGESSCRRGNPSH